MIVGKIIQVWFWYCITTSYLAIYGRLGAVKIIGEGWLADCVRDQYCFAEQDRCVCHQNIVPGISAWWPAIARRLFSYWMQQYWNGSVNFPWFQSNQIASVRNSTLQRLYRIDDQWGRSSIAKRRLGQVRARLAEKQLNLPLSGRRKSRASRWRGDSISGDYSLLGRGTAGIGVIM